MRQRQQQDTERVARKPKQAEPISEGIRKERRPRGFYSGMGDEEILEYARAFVSEMGICGRKGLAKADQPLYNQLRRRGLLGIVNLKDLRGRKGDWFSLSDEELVAFAKDFVAERGITTKKGLRKENPRLSQTLYRRVLLDEFGFAPALRDWDSAGRRGIIGYAKRLIRERGITGRWELGEADPGLYQALRKRGLLDRIGLKGKRYSWMGLDGEELVSYAKDFVAERGIKGRGELKMEENRLYEALARRRLLSEAGLESEARERRGWNAMGDGELAELASRAIAESGIGSRAALARKDSGMYAALRKRGLLDAVFYDIESSGQRKNADSMLPQIRKALCEYSGDGG